MKTRKTVFLALFAIVMSAGLVFFGCDLFNPSSPDTPSAITFSVTAYTPSGENSNRLDIRFSAEVTGLTANDIRISPPDGLDVSKGNLSGSGTDWQLGITVSNGFAGSYSCSVSISKDGISSSTQYVSITNNKGKANFDVGSTKVENGKATLTITLTKDVSLTTGQISLTAGTGKATSGTLTGGPKVYELPLTGVTPGTINIKINNSDVNDAAKPLELSEDSPTTTDPTPGNGGQVIAILIQPEDPSTYSKIISGNGSVELGKPRKYTTIITPLNATNQTLSWDSLDSSIATVKDGVVTPVKVGKTRITAKATDGSGVGTSLEIEVLDRVIPSNFSFSYVGNFSNGGYNSASGSGANPNITLYIGDKPVILFTELQNGSSSRTNDQSVVFSPATSTKYRLSPQYGSDEDIYTEVPRKQFVLEPLAVTTTVEQVKFQAAFSPALIGNLSVNVAVLPVSKPKITYYKQDGVTSMPGTAGDHSYTGSGWLYVAIEPDAPYTGITFTANSSVSISGPTVKESPRKANWYTVTRTANFGYNSNINVDFTITDMGGKTSVGNISLGNTSP